MELMTLTLTRTSCFRRNDPSLLSYLFSTECPGPTRAGSCSAGCAHARACSNHAHASFFMASPLAPDRINHSMSGCATRFYSIIATPTSTHKVVQAESVDVQSPPVVDNTNTHTHTHTHQ